MSREGRPVHTGDVEGKGIRRASLARRRDRDVLRRVAQQGAASSWLHKKALRESRKAERNYIRLERKIAARRHDRWDVGKDSTRPWGYRGALRSITGGCEEAMTLSVFNDIQRMTDAASS